MDFENREFVESQSKQRECLAVATGFDWTKIDTSKVLTAIGLVTNPHPPSLLRGVCTMSTPSSWARILRDKIKRSLMRNHPDYDKELC